VTKLKVWGLTDKGKVRKENQDAFFAEDLTRGFTLAVVCDGMGGTHGGGLASKLAIETFVAEIRRLTADASFNLDDSQSALEAAVAKASSAVLTYAKKHSDCRDMGTTLVAALSDYAGNSVIINVGDSRCYAVRRGNGIGNAETDTDVGHIEQITKDHSLVEEMIDRGEILRQDARAHPKRNLITRALSADVNATPDFYSLKLLEGDLLLLCSDGLSNEVDPREIAFELLYGEPDTAALRCLTIALDRGASDNVTVVVVSN
jgi:protein phosphatase